MSLWNPPPDWRDEPTPFDNIPLLDEAELDAALAQLPPPPPREPPWPSVRVTLKDLLTETD